MNTIGRRQNGIDHNMGRNPCASALRLISWNALTSGSARNTIDAGKFALENLQDRSDTGQTLFTVYPTILAGICMIELFMRLDFGVRFTVGICVKQVSLACCGVDLIMG